MARTKLYSAASGLLMFRSSAVYDCGYRANQKLFGGLARLTPERFTQAVAGSDESIRNTLVMS